MRWPVEFTGWFVFFGLLELGVFIWCLVVWNRLGVVLKPLYPLARNIAWIGFAAALLGSLITSLEEGEGGFSLLTAVLAEWTWTLIPLIFAYIHTFAAVLVGTYLAVSMKIYPLKVLRLPSGVMQPPALEPKSFWSSILGVTVGWLLLYYLNGVLIPNGSWKGLGELGAASDFFYITKGAAVDEPFYRLLLPVLCARALGGTLRGWWIGVIISSVLWSFPPLESGGVDWAMTPTYFGAGMALSWLFLRQGLEACFLAVLLFHVAFLLGLPVMTS